ncbi:hypothetical protein BIW11_10428 [Tropilaelaps mercedesae]|uniref:Uncharacterized protein n=1 Tax=Tropilaelaps mercedesae TaxID=418985 RepID=A0A1V9XFU3_9ACAR|nr:hypothetical protein BIW11_10428 [Tropilaelaps mercedesae]
MNSAAVIGRQLRQQNRAPGPLAVPGRPRAPSHVNLGPLPASVTAPAGSSPHKDSGANKNQEEDDKQHSLIPAYVSLGCVWKFAKALSPGVLLIAIGTAMCVVGFLAEQLSTTVVIVDSVSNRTSTTVNRSMEYHLHNLSFAGPAIMGLGGICIVAACVLTFGVKDHHHRVVPVDEKRPSVGEALVPILPLPPKGRRRPKPPIDAQAAQTAATVTSNGGGGGGGVNAALDSGSSAATARAADEAAMAKDPWPRPAGAGSASHQTHTNTTTTSSGQNATTVANSAVPVHAVPVVPMTGRGAGHNSNNDSTNSNNNDNNNYNSDRTVNHASNGSSNNSGGRKAVSDSSTNVRNTTTNNRSSSSSSTNSINLSANHHHHHHYQQQQQQQQQQHQHERSWNSDVAEDGRRKSSAVAGSKTTIVPTRSSEAYRGVSTDNSTNRSSSSSSSRSMSSSSRSKPASTTAGRAGPPLQVAGTAAGPDGTLVGYPDLVHPDYSAYPDYPERHLAGSALSAAALGDPGSGCSTPASNLSLPPIGASAVWTCPIGGGGGGGGGLSGCYASYHSSCPLDGGGQRQPHLPGPSDGVGRSPPVGQASPYSSNSGAQPSSLSFVPLHTRTGATPPFKMRPAPSLSTSSTCTSFLLSPQYETTFIPSPTDLQIVDPDGCDTPSSFKSFYMSRSASASSGLHLDMYLSRLPVSLRMQLSSKLFASMESDGLSSISTSDTDLANNEDIVLRDFSKGLKRTSFNSTVGRMANSRTTSNADSQEVTPLLADDDSPLTPADSGGGGGGGGGGSLDAGRHSLTSGGQASFDRRFPLLRQAATEGSRALNGKMAPTSGSHHASGVNQISGRLANSHQTNAISVAGDSLTATEIAQSSVPSAVLHLSGRTLGMGRPTWPPPEQEANDKRWTASEPRDTTRNESDTTRADQRRETNASVAHSEVRRGEAGKIELTSTSSEVEEQGHEANTEEPDEVRRWRSGTHTTNSSDALKF